MEKIIDYFSVAGKVYDVCLPVLKDFGDWKIDVRNACKEMRKLTRSILDDESYFNWEPFLGTYFAMSNVKREYEQKIDAASFAPFWMYESDCVYCGHLHRNYNKLLLRYDDSFWEKHYPPNSWECGCLVRNFTAEEIKGLEIKTLNEVVNYFVLPAPFDINFAKKEWTDIFEKLFIKHFVMQLYDNLNFTLNEDDE